MLRFAFLSDIHLNPDIPESIQGFRLCLRHIAAQKPDFVVTGGDHIWDSMAQNRDFTLRQWDLFHQIMREETQLPVEPVIGNHDCWGIEIKRTGMTGKEAEFGKAMALKQLGISSRYRSFERGIWRFIVLDSVFEDPDRGYTARLDEEQFDWLEQELPKSGRPTVVLSHIPIVSVTPYFFGENERKGDWNVPGPWMHLDVRRIRALFQKHPQVKLCLAGHMHQADRVDYLGVTYMVCGSVSGDIWCGDFELCRPAYSLVTLRDNGTFSRDLKHYRRRISRTTARPKG